MKWFILSADQGNTRAQFNLGLIYFNGNEIPKNKVKGLEWIRKAASGGYADAQKFLAKLNK